jgi:hypothetical protein
MRDKLKQCALWLHANRTKVMGYAGVALGAVQGAQGWHTMVLGVAVALVGHYNDWTNKAVA